MLIDENSPDPINQMNFSPSDKGDKYVFHRGAPALPRPTFTSPLSHPKWPQNLHQSGTQIYSYNDESLCLPPIQKRVGRKSDRILRFDSHFESGNLDSAFHLGQDTYRLNLQYDANKSGSCQWFYFAINNTRKDVVYTFYISGFHKAKDVLNSGSKIFMYSQKASINTGTSWSRSGYNYAYGYIPSENPKNFPIHSISKPSKISPAFSYPNSLSAKPDSASSSDDQDSPTNEQEPAPKPKPKNRASLQFQIKFPYDFDTVYLCYSLPYTYSDLLRSISHWTNKSPLLVTNETLCETVGGKSCPLLTITSPQFPNEKKKIIFITGRVHPGESNSSYVTHGLIDFLLSPTIASKYLLEHYVFKIIPMINIDGVIEGFYRCSLSGYDLNRVWTFPDPNLHPVVYHAKQFMRDNQMSIAVYIDFHGHCRLHGTFAYGCPNEFDNLLKDKEKVFPRLISMLSDAFLWDKCEFSYPNARKSSGRIVARTEFGIIQSFTVETSFGGIPQGPMSGLLNDERIWKGVGAKIGESMFHFFNQATGVRKFVERELATGIDPSRAEFSALQWQRQMKREMNMDHKIVLPSKSKPNQYCPTKITRNTGLNIGLHSFNSQKSPHLRSFA